MNQLIVDMKGYQKLEGKKLNELRLNADSQRLENYLNINNRFSQVIMLVTYLRDTPIMKKNIM